MIKMKMIKLSHNKKTGSISQSYSDCSSCPKDCKFKGNGCYGEGFTTRHTWSKCDTDPRDLDMDGTTHIIRHNVCGDIAISGTNDIDSELLNILNKKYRGHLAYTYTHCAKTTRNFDIAKSSKMIINFSCESIDEVEKCMANGVPCVLAVKSMDKDITYINGIKYMRCMGNCKNCKRCMKKDRKYVIVFEAHGQKKNKIDFLGSI